MCLDLPTWGDLNRAYDSLVNVKAQADIVLYDTFIPFINRASSVKEVTDMFSKTQQSDWKKKLEPQRPIHKPWIELDSDSDFTWSPPKRVNYHSSNGGPPASPSMRIVQLVRSTSDLGWMFLSILPFAFLRRLPI